MLSLGQFSKVLEMLYGMRQFNRAACFSAALEEFGLLDQGQDNGGCFWQCATTTKMLQTIQFKRIIHCIADVYIFQMEVKHYDISSLRYDIINKCLFLNFLIFYNLKQNANICILFLSANIRHWRTFFILTLQMHISQRQARKIMQSKAPEIITIKKENASFLTSINLQETASVKTPQISHEFPLNESGQDQALMIFSSLMTKIILLHIISETFLNKNIFVSMLIFLRHFI